MAIPKMAIAVEPERAPNIDGAKLKTHLWATAITVTQPENPNISRNSDLLE